MQEIKADVVIIGGGVGGLSTALALGPQKVLVLTKSKFGQGGSTPMAQGGIAVAMGHDDHPHLHAVDTLVAGDGLSTAEVVDVLTAEGPSRVRELLALGAEFDRDIDGELKFGREAAHSRRRIVHARGDSTGAEVERALVAAVVQRPNIEVLDDCYVSDLLQHDGVVIGAQGVRGGRVLRVFAKAVVLASGGVGRIYRYTTNPIESCGDGLAMVGRIGAVLSDVEFVQFHPTALCSGQDPLPLLTEALRGEGATLHDEKGERFMLQVHADAELAPRDVVARGIWAVQQRNSRVYLDARIIGEDFSTKFPTVWGLCQGSGLDPRRDLLPVSPAAHYHMGGLRVDRNGRSSCPGLWACGEVAATGVHGANRLASNSLLEGLVFGARVGQDIMEQSDFSPQELHGVEYPAITTTTHITEAEQETAWALRCMMWDNVGLVRCEQGMQVALDYINAIVENKEPKSLMLRNMLDAAEIITQAALQRRESRGGHFRSDYPAHADVATSHPFVFTGNGPWI